MRQQATFLMQSKFYSPAFNAAIFDGPIRIYFAQYQESIALKIYFELQEQLKELYFDARETYKKNGTHIFIMMYPTSETFALSFGDKKSMTQNIMVDRVDTDYLVGVRGPIEEAEIDQIAQSLEVIIRELKSQVPVIQPEAALAEL
ncbi:MAG: hypothetical protein AABZ31_01480 [Bdellovibrionota bacterium]